MDDLDRFFPIVPQNVPSDDLESYLRMYADEAGAFKASQDSHAATHAEWAVNVRMPKMRALQGLGTILGPDYAVMADPSGDVYVTGTWAQRAINAVGASSSSWASLLHTPIQVDGIVGSVTMGGLLALWRGLLSGHGTMPTLVAAGTASDPGRVRISGNMMSVLGAYQQVADPPRPSSSGGGTPLPDATPFVAPVAAGIGQAIGVLAVLGLGAWALMRR